MNERYDVVIIGSGIGGLVCGCYLAKSGLRVLIVEQHYKPGGCCTSFERRGFKFDVGVHYLGSLREEGILFRVLRDFNLLNKIKILRNDPTDRIIIPGKTVFIRKDKSKTKQELFLNFPNEKENIDRFFNFVLTNNFLSIVSKTKNLTFKQLLNYFFQDRQLKAILASLLGNFGVASSRASALAATVLFSEYIFDGGYYPEGGIQVLPDLLADHFKASGGKLVFSTMVSKIIVKNNKAIGVQLDNNKSIFSQFVISNADATLTFKKLVTLETQEKKIVSVLKPSTSAFIAYLGLKGNIKIAPIHFTTWFFNSLNIDDCYNKSKIKDILDINYIFCSFPSLIDKTLAPKNKSIVRLFIEVKYNNINRISSYKDIIYKKLIEKAKNIIPELEKNIEVKEIATPLSFYKYTLNRDGALFGWEATRKQIQRTILPYCTNVKNLYLVGHWVTSGIGHCGIASVASSGRFTAEAILNSKLQR